ncbi:MAG: PriCT-2 domain-containing protein, partial [Rickettsiales bacterium]|nr:PriCT-2 domain-containing protein [Rickettsiales bacterium]
IVSTGKDGHGEIYVKWNGNKLKLRMEPLYDFSEENKSVPHKLYFADPEFSNLEISTELWLNKKGFPANRNANFQKCSFVYECDHLSLEEQIIQANRLVSLGVINRVVHSGSKSLHCRATVKDAPTSEEEYKWLWYYIARSYKIIDADKACSHNGRSSRRADAIRESNGAIQKLIHQNNAVLDLNWRPLFGEYKIQLKKERELKASAAANYSQQYRGSTDEDISRALSYISAGCEYPEWRNVGMALHSYYNGSSEGLTVWENWSAGSEKYKPGETAKQYKAFKHNGDIGIGTLFWLAAQNGWQRR